jgi:transcriptional regulator with XRE-family HTH domain
LEFAYIKLHQVSLINCAFLLVKQTKSFSIFANIWQVNIETMNSQFGDRIRTLREKQHLYLRQVAPWLEMDTVQLSEIEKGIRQLKREKISIISEILKESTDELMTLWSADQIYAVVKVNKEANEAMLVAEKNIYQKIVQNIKN